MSDEAAPKAGTIAWHDLTVEDAESVRDFYQQVIGWESSGVDMGEYQDFSMFPAGAKDDPNQCVAGICHARGGNAEVPPQWLVYFIVKDVDASASQAKSMGGKILVGPKDLGGGRFAVIQDPAGAVCALWKS